MYTVMTIHIGNYEVVHEVKARSANARYILVTDNPKLESRTWDVVYDSKLHGTVWDKVMYVRWHPWMYTDDDIVVSIDGSIGINKSLDRIVAYHRNLHKDLTLMIHPVRTTIAQEYNAWMDLRNYPHEQAQRCMELMRECGYDVEHYRGLLQAGFMIRTRNEAVMQWCDDVYKTLLITGDGHCDRLDQTIASFILQKYYKMHVLPVSEWIVRGEYMTSYRHGSFRPMIRKDLAIPYLYNKKIKYQVI